MDQINRRLRSQSQQIASSCVSFGFAVALLGHRTNTGLTAFVLPIKSYYGHPLLNANWVHFKSSGVSRVDELSVLRIDMMHMLQQVDVLGPVPVPHGIARRAVTLRPPSSHFGKRDFESCLSCGSWINLYKSWHMLQASHTMRMLPCKSAAVMNI